MISNGRLRHGLILREKGPEEIFHQINLLEHTYTVFPEHNSDDFELLRLSLYQKLARTDGSATAPQSGVKWDRRCSNAPARQTGVSCWCAALPSPSAATHHAVRERRNRGTRSVVGISNHWNASFWSHDPSCNANMR